MLVVQTARNLLHLAKMNEIVKCKIPDEIKRNFILCIVHTIDVTFFVYIGLEVKILL